jgi:hypothetical protein
MTPATRFHAAVPAIAGVAAVRLLRTISLSSRAWTPAPAAWWGSTPLVDGRLTLSIGPVPH